MQTRRAHPAISWFFTISPSIAYAHANEAFYIIGGTIIFIQMIFLILTLLVKSPRYSLASLLSIPASWALVYLLTDNLINIESKSNISILLLMTPVYILFFAVLHSIKLKNKPSA